jgi:PiT family inorganic phosphate transporter
VLSCHAAMAVGTLIGGWRIVHTMGSRITHIKPMQGFCAETGGAATVFMAIALGTPISTTHTIAGSITGVGLARKGSSVRWDVAGDVIFAWALTLPAAGLMAVAVYWLTALVVH